MLNTGIFDIFKVSQSLNITPEPALNGAGKKVF